MMPYGGHGQRMTLRTLVPLLGMLILAGCAGRGETQLGYLELASFEATSTYDPLTGVARVDVRGSVRASGAEGVRVDVYVVDRPCAIGPESDPNAFLAHETQRPGDPDAGVNETREYGASFDVRVTPGREFAAIATARADNAIGPVFGHCSSLRAI